MSKVEKESKKDKVIEHLEKKIEDAENRLKDYRTRYTQNDAAITEYQKRLTRMTQTNSRISGSIDELMITLNSDKNLLKSLVGEKPKVKVGKIEDQN